MTTGDPRADAAIAAAVAAFGAAFPGRIRSCLLEGSGADGTMVATSDVDLTVVFVGALTGDERRQAEVVAARCAAASAVELDCTVADEAELAAGVMPNLKTGSVCVSGDDIRPALRVMPLDAWTRDRMHSSFWRLGTLFGRSPVVRTTLDYPDPAGEFFGYDRRTMRLADGAVVPSTRDLIRATGWVATALIAHRAGRYVDRKSMCHHVYAECFADEWGALLAAIYARCRTAWQYRIPDAPEERAVLQDMCARTLGFENHFLAAYVPYLMDELASGDAARVHAALRPLRRLTCADPRVVAALAPLSHDADPAVRAAAAHAIGATVRG